MYLLWAVSALGLLALVACTRVVKGDEAGLVEKNGRYRRTIWRVGLVLPGIERVHVVPLDSYRLHLPAEPFRTGGGRQVYVDVEVHYEVSDPVAATYAVDNPHLAIEQTVVHHLRSLVSAEDGLPDDRIMSIAMRQTLEPIDEHWGFRTTEVRLRLRVPQEEPQPVA